jgi:ribosome-associated heat shock protein Hsp15
MFKSRSQAQVAIMGGLIRLNSQRIESTHKNVSIGDVITLPRGDDVVVLCVVSIPPRRGPAAQAQACYTLL